MKDIRVAIAQYRSEALEKDRNLRKMEEAVEDAAAEGADLLIFPELFLTGYNIRNEVFRLAEGRDGKSVESMAKTAAEHGMHIIFGMPERDGDRIYNSAVLIDPDSDVGIYRKAMLPNFGAFEEALYYTPGREFPVFHTGIGVIGISICYDIFYPEINKIYAAKGAELLVNISASPSISRALFEKVLPARAIENGAYMLYSNNVGTQIGLVFWGGSRVIGPKGEVLAKGEPYKEELVVADLKADELRLARQYRPTMRDTRPQILEELYKVWRDF